MGNLSRRGRRLAAGLVCGLVGVGCFAAEVAGPAAVPYATGAVFGAPLKVEGAGDRAMALALRGDVVYAACGDAGLHVLRIRPEGGFERLGGLPERVRVVLTERIRRRIGLWDFADPDLPKFPGCWTVSGNPGIAAFHRERIVVPCGYQGVLLQK